MKNITKIKIKFKIMKIKLWLFLKFGLFRNYWKNLIYED